MKRKRSRDRPPVDPPAPYVTEMKRGLTAARLRIVSWRASVEASDLGGYTSNENGTGGALRSMDMSCFSDRNGRWPVGRGSRTLLDAGGALSSRAGAGLGCRSTPGGSSSSMFRRFLHGTE